MENFQFPTPSFPPPLLTISKATMHEDPLFAMLRRQFPDYPFSPPFPNLPPLPPPQAPYQYFSHPSTSAPAAVVWSKEDDKVFENALVEFPEGTADRWVLIAQRLPGKSPKDVLDHYSLLLQDVMSIDAGRVALPNYDDDDDGLSDTSSPRRSKSREERKKGVPWTEDEHRRFLEGLEKFGRGDWRSISRNAVVTRTPTQVASHAQKYFLRLSNAEKKQKKRGSIHDITKP